MFGLPIALCLLVVESKVRTSAEDATNLLMMKRIVNNLGAANFGVILTMTDRRNKTQAEA